MKDAMGNELQVGDKILFIPSQPITRLVCEVASIGEGGLMVVKPAARQGVAEVPTRMEVSTTIDVLCQPNQPIMNAFKVALPNGEKPKLLH